MQEQVNESTVGPFHQREPTNSSGQALVSLVSLKRNR